MGFEKSGDLEMINGDLERRRNVKMKSQQYGTKSRVQRISPLAENLNGKRLNGIPGRTGFRKRLESEANRKTLLKPLTLQEPVCFISTFQTISIAPAYRFN